MSENQFSWLPTTIKIRLVGLIVVVLLASLGVLDRVAVRKAPADGQKSAFRSVHDETPRFEFQGLTGLDQAGTPLAPLGGAGPIDPISPLSESKLLDKGATSPIELSDLPPLPESLTDPAPAGDPAPMLAPLASPTVASALVDRELASIPVPSSFEDVKPSPAKDLLERGADLLGRGKWDEAIAVFYKVLDIDPASAQAYESLGHCYLGKNELSKAVVNLDSAIRLNPKSVSTYVARGSANIKLRYFERAHDDLNTAVKLDPNSIGALTWRSIAYINEGRPREARENCNAVLKLNSDILDAYVVRCLANLQLGDPNGARADYRAVVQRSQNQDSPKMLQGWFEAFGQKATLPAAP